ncbi:MAG: DUF6443 domain-containing protein, partial [Bacteroidota bacterium]
VTTSGKHLEHAFFDETTGLKTTTNTIIPYLYKVFDYEMTFEANQNPLSGIWDNTTTVDEYDMVVGKPSKMSYRGWVDQEELSWDANNKLITKRKFKNFEWDYDYYKNGSDATKLLASITGIDNQTAYFRYDDLMRLEMVLSRPKVSAPNIYNTSDFNVFNTFTYNYVGTNSVSSSTNFTSVSGSALTNRSTIEYFDGLGRSIQKVEKAYSEAGKDVISGIEFDNQGRIEKTYEAFESSNSDGSYIPFNSWPSIYTENDYELSPLNRIIGVTPPDWDKTEYKYGKNITALTIDGSTYPAGSLIKTTVEDPYNDKTITYKDLKGRLIRSVKANASESETAETSYSYDHKDRVNKIVPPASNENEYEEVYSYTYDGRNNILTKKIPDQAVINYQYDNRNLMTYLQDGNMLALNRWLRTQYDDYGRVIETGYTETPTN